MRLPSSQGSQNEDQDARRLCVVAIRVGRVTASVPWMAIPEGVRSSDVEKFACATVFSGTEIQMAPRDGPVTAGAIDHLPISVLGT